MSTPSWPQSQIHVKKPGNQQCFYIKVHTHEVDVHNLVNVWVNMGYSALSNYFGGYNPINITFWVALPVAGECLAKWFDDLSIK